MKHGRANFAAKTAQSARSGTPTNARLNKKQQVFVFRHSPNSMVFEQNSVVLVLHGWFGASVNVLFYFFISNYFVVEKELADERRWFLLHTWSILFDSGSLVHLLFLTWRFERVSDLVVAYVFNGFWLPFVNKVRLGNLANIVLLKTNSSV